MAEIDTVRFYQNRRNMVLLAVVCTFLWGCAFPAVKAGYSLFAIGGEDVAGQMVFAGVRFFTAGLVTLALSWAAEKRPPLLTRQQIPGGILLGLMQTGLQYFFFYVGLAHTTGTRGSILNATSTFMTVLMVGILWRTKEPLTGRKVLGCLLGFGGVVLVNLGGGMAEQTFTLLGEGFVLLSAFSSAVAALMTKAFAQSTSPMTLTGWQLSIGGFVLLAAGLFMGGTLRNGGPKGFLLLAFMVMISTAAFSIWTALLKHNPVSQVSVYNFLIPVFGTALSGLVLGEGFPGFGGLAALALVCLGIVAVNGAARKQPV